MELRADDAESRASACVDYTRPFDWEAFDGRLCNEPTRLGPKPIVVLDGVYTARPELTDLVDLRVLVELSDAVRLERLLLREGTIGPWERQWHEAEHVYFQRVMPATEFDIILRLPQTGPLAP